MSVIEIFLAKSVEDAKKRLKNDNAYKNSDEEKKMKKENELEKKFEASSWLPLAANNCKNISLTTHIAKFVHPDASASAVVFHGDHKANGLVQSGNVNTTRVKNHFDQVATASYLPIYNFLFSPMPDGNSVLHHMENDTPEIREEFEQFVENYDELREKFLQVREDKSSLSDSRIKQIYFPVGDGEYHLLSVMTPMLLMSEMQARIAEYRREMFNVFNAVKKLFSQNKPVDGFPYEEFFGMTHIKVGGSQPQNISALNSSENNGSYYFLSAIPPTLAENRVRIPRQDFFKMIRLNETAGLFLKLHAEMEDSRNNFKIRNKIYTTIENIIDEVLLQALKLQNQPAGWSEKTALPLYQKIWLDAKYGVEKEEEDTQWTEELVARFAIWFKDAYEKILKGKKLQLNDDDLALIEKIIKERGGDFR